MKSLSKIIEEIEEARNQINDGGFFLNKSETTEIKKKLYSLAKDLRERAKALKYYLG